MNTKLAAWMVQREYADNMDDAVYFVEAVKEGNCPDSLLEKLQKNIDVMMAIGGKITAENAVTFLRDSFKTAEKLIAFWEANPKDTNAIFFNKRLEEYNANHS